MEVLNWRIRKVENFKGESIMKTYSVRVGRVFLSINTKNHRLNAVIGSNLTFLGGNNNQGYFNSIDECKQWIESKREELEKIKSMRKLIYIQ